MADREPPHKPRNLTEARASWRRWLTELVGKDRVDEVIEEAKTDPLPSPYETLDAYDREDVARLQTAQDVRPDERSRLNARLAEFRIDDANQEE